MSHIINLLIKKQNWGELTEQLRQEKGFIKPMGGRGFSRNQTFEAESDLNETCAKILEVIREQGFYYPSLFHAIIQLNRIFDESESELVPASLSGCATYLKDLYEGHPIVPLKNLARQI